jgi:myxalamid-type polyketide synthase MxaF
MAPFGDALAQALGGLRPAAARLPLFSTVTGGQVMGPELDGGHWADNVRDTVRFADAVGAALAAGHRDFLEIGPHPLLAGDLEECLFSAGVSGCVTGSLRRGRDGSGALLRSAAALFAHGHEVDWDRIAGAWGQRVPMPAHPWRRKRYWLEPPWSDGRAARPSWGDEGHPLLGTSLSSSVHPGTTFWEGSPDPARSPYLTAMELRGESVLSAAAYAEMALSAAARLWPDGPVEVGGLTFEQMLVIAEGEGPALQSVAEERESGDAGFQVSSRTGDRWVRHAYGDLRPAAPDARAVTTEPLDRIRDRCSDHHDGSEHYRRLAGRGVAIGESLRGVCEVWLGEGEALGRVTPPDGSLREGGHRVHPAVLDSCLQVLVALCDAAGGGGHVITSVERFWMDSAGAGEIWAHARLRDGGAECENGERIGDLRLAGPDGRTLGGADGLRLRPLPPWITVPRRGRGRTSVRPGVAPGRTFGSRRGPARRLARAGRQGRLRTGPRGTNAPPGPALRPRPARRVRRAGRAGCARYRPFRSGRAPRLAAPGLRGHAACGRRPPRGTGRPGRGRSGRGRSGRARSGAGRVRIRGR